MFYPFNCYGDSKNTDIWFIIQRKNIPTPGIDLSYNIKLFQISDVGHFENGRHFFHRSNLRWPYI